MAETSQTLDQNSRVYDVERGTYRRAFNESTMVPDRTPPVALNTTAENVTADRAAFENAPMQSQMRPAPAMQPNEQAAEQKASADTAASAKTQDAEQAPNTAQPVETPTAAPTLRAMFQAEAQPANARILQKNPRQKHPGYDRKPCARP